MKGIFRDYNISTESTAVSILKNSVVLSKTTSSIKLYKTKNAVDVMLCMKFVATQTLLVKMHILVRHLNHYSIVLNNTVHLVTMEMIKQSSNT